MVVNLFFFVLFLVPTHQDSDCVKKRFLYGKEFRVEYKVCKGVILNDSAYYFHGDELLIKQHWNNGVSSYLEHTLASSKFSADLRSLKSQFYKQVMVVEVMSPLKQGQESKIKIFNVADAVSYHSMHAIVKLSADGLLVTPQVSSGEIVDIYGSLGREKDVLILRRRVQ